VATAFLLLAKLVSLVKREPKELAASNAIILKLVFNTTPNSTKLGRGSFKNISISKI